MWRLGKISTHPKEKNFVIWKRIHRELMTWCGYFTHGAFLRYHKSTSSTYHIFKLVRIVYEAVVLGAATIEDMSAKWLRVCFSRNYIYWFFVTQKTAHCKVYWKMCTTVLRFDMIHALWALWEKHEYLERFQFSGVILNFMEVVLGWQHWRSNYHTWIWRDVSIIIEYIQLFIFYFLW